MNINLSTYLYASLFIYLLINLSIFVFLSVNTFPRNLLRKKSTWNIFAMETRWLPTGEQTSCTYVCVVSDSLNADVWACAHLYLDNYALLTSEPSLTRESFRETLRFALTSIRASGKFRAENRSRDTRTYTRTHARDTRWWALTGVGAPHSASQKNRKYTMMERGRTGNKWRINVERMGNKQMTNKWKQNEVERKWKTNGEQAETERWNKWGTSWRQVANKCTTNERWMKSKRKMNEVQSVQDAKQKGERQVASEWTSENDKWGTSREQVWSKWRNRWKTNRRQIQNKQRTSRAPMRKEYSEQWPDGVRGRVRYNERIKSNIWETVPCERKI